MELQKDNLEEFFRKSFQRLEEQPFPEGWDEPSGKVWERIEANIVEQGTVRRAAFFNKNRLLLMLLIVLLAVLAWQWWSFRKEVDCLEREINRQSATLHALRQSLVKQENQTAGTAAAGEDVPEQPVALSPQIAGEKPGFALNFSKNPTNGQTNIPQTRLQPDLPNPNLVPGFSASNPNENSPATETPPPPGNTTDTPLAEHYTNAFAQSGQSSLSGLQTSAATPLDVSQQEELPLLASKTTFVFATSAPLALSLPNTTPAMTYPSAENKGLLVGASFSPSYSYRSVYYKMRNVSTPYEKTESPRMSFLAGATVGVDLRRHWRLWSGLNYQRIYQESKHTLGLRYTTTGAVTEPNGDVVNTYRTSLPTSYGEAEVEVRIANEAQSSVPNLNEGRIFPVQFLTSLRLEHIGIPLLAEYHFGKGRFSFSLKGGLVGSLLLNKDLDVGTARPLNGRLRHRQTLLLKDRLLNNIAPATLDLHLSAGLRVGLSEHLSLAFEPAFRSNLTPAFSDEKIATRMYSLAVLSGFYYRF